MSSTGSSPSVPPIDEQRASATATDERAPEESNDEFAERDVDPHHDFNADADGVEVDAAERAADRRAERIRLARRRRDLLVGLVGLAALTFILAVTVAPAFWIAQVAADAAVIGYVVRLRRGAIRRERREARLAARLRPTARALLDVETGDRDDFSTDWRSRLGTRERPGARERMEALQARYDADTRFAEAHTDRFAAIRPDGYRVVDLDDDDPTFTDLDTYPVADDRRHRSYGYGAYDPGTHDYGTDDYGTDDHGIDGYDEPYEPPKAVNG